MAYQTIPAAAGDTRSPHYQELKAKVHQELLNRLNLERLTRVSRREAEPEIRELINHMLENEAETTPLSLFERENLIIDVLNELFGLGPLEALLKDRDISDILVNRYDQVLHRTQRRARGDGHRLQGRPAPDADHRAHRQHRRPAHRRDQPDGGRAPAGRLARERDHSAAGARRSGAVDPPFPHRPARAPRIWSSASR